MTTDDTMEGILEAVGQGAEDPPDTDEAVGSILARLGIDGDRPVPIVPRAPAAAQPVAGGPSWSLAAMLLLGIALGVVAAIFALRPSGTAPDVDLAARGAGSNALEDAAPAPQPLDGGWIAVEVEDPEPGSEPDAEALPTHEPVPVLEREVAPEVPSIAMEVPHRQGGSSAPDAAVEHDERVAMVDPTPDVPRAPTAVRAGTTEGLLRHGDAGMTIRGTTAVLRDGLLTFVRNDSVRPTVDRVRFATVDATAVPVGTVFTSAAAPGTGAVSVQEGRVFLVAADGRPLAEVRAGESGAVVHHPTEGVVWIPLDGLPLDAIAAQVPEGSDADPEALRSLIAELRLAPVSGEALSTLLEFGEGTVE